MEIYFLNESFEPVCVADDCTCFIRRRNFYDCDEFELHCRQQLFSAAKGAAYITASDSITDIYLIETVICKDNSLQIKGRGCDCLFERYVIYPTCQISGTGEQILRQLVSQYTDMTCAASSGIGSTVERGQVTGYGLLDYMKQLAKEQQLSFRVCLDPDEGELVFSVYEGKDRSASSSDYPPVIFSDDMENLMSCEYNFSQRDYRNIAIVAGQGTGSDRIWVTVDNSDGVDGRMLYVDARDIQQEEGMSSSRYLELLRRRGLEKLAQHCIVESFEGEVSPQFTDMIGSSFDLGDFVTVRSTKLGFSLDCRITSVEQVFENGMRQTQLFFGDGFLSTIGYIERMYK